MTLDTAIDRLSIDERNNLQLNRLRSLVAFVLENSRFYRERLNETGIASDDIRELSDLSRLPFTRKTDLRDKYPFGMFAVPMEEIAEIHASSGTTGNPTVVAYTKNDIALWSNVMARTLSIAGADAGA